ncbi:peptidase [Microbacterium sp. STN6]|uniref:peptidase n=1 Tax=Microbacterium sp. STN6 TaxID=2995588 RepID=UPI0022609026|nr:peptidase [Microbacterium sp. STN6]MCX7521259.1 peptidase [Microbacterium sp. STN6]
MIDWISFFSVAFASIVGASLVVALYAFGLRLLSTAGRPPHVEPAEFTDAITVVTPEEAEREAKRVRKARKRSPLSRAQKRLALAVARLCFVLCAALVLFGVWLIIPGFH